MTEKQSATPSGNHSQIGARMIIASRYAECLHRLARQACQVDLPELAEKLSDVAASIEAISDEIVLDDRGGLVLRRAGRLIGTVESLVDKAARRGMLH